MTYMSCHLNFLLCLTAVAYRVAPLLTFSPVEAKHPQKVLRYTKWSGGEGSRTPVQEKFRFWLSTTILQYYL
jgi:hypothetical protein